MFINYHKISEISTKQRAIFMQRSELGIKQVTEQVKPIIEDVKNNGDSAIIKYAKLFDGANLATGAIKVTEEEFAKAEANLPTELKQAIIHCAGNVKKFHQAQLDKEQKIWLTEIEKGIYAGEKISPISSVGLYVPRGKGCFPSVMYMLCVPAVIAGVSEIAVCTPPTELGNVDDASLFAAKIAGVKNVYKSGGATAIAAFAYGTKTIPKVAKVLGPGNSYVAAARRLLSDILHPGSPAGPSEALIIADETANPYNTALDILNEAEHGPDSASILVTTCENLGQQVKSLLPDLIAKLPQKRQEFCLAGFGKTGYGGIFIADNIEQAIDFANEYAVEHLLLKVKNTAEILPKLCNVGEILIGENTPISLGNFGIGVNAILPTGKHAKTYSATSIWDFLIRSTIAYADEEGLHKIGPSAKVISDYEGFAAHSNAITERKSVADEKSESDAKNFLRKYLIS